MWHLKEQLRRERVAEIVKSWKSYTFSADYLSAASTYVVLRCGLKTKPTVSTRYKPANFKRKFKQVYMSTFYVIIV